MVKNFKGGHTVLFEEYSICSLVKITQHILNWRGKGKKWTKYIMTFLEKTIEMHITIRRKYVGKQLFV